jgi:hypothetical protein
MPDAAARRAIDFSAVVVAVVTTAARTASKGGRRASGATRPLGRGLAGAVRVLPGPRHVRALLGAVAERGAEERMLLARRLSRVLDLLVPLVARELLARLDLTEIVSQNVDLNALLDGVDLDEAVTRIDLDAAISRVDLDKAAARLDLDAAVRRIDLDALVRRIDLEAATERIDITALVLERVDLDAIVDRVLAHLDLASLTQQVLEAIDMPEVIRESSGAMASDTVREIRMQGVAADQAVRRAMERLRGHERPIRTSG